MTAASLLKSQPVNGLQPVDLSRHLGGMADLLETCFGAEMDAGGRYLLREMRFLSRTGPALHVLNALLLSSQPWSQGFVWVEEGKVVGTISTQPATAGSRTWLIANVGVHPGFRRRGIAGALMRAAIDMARGRAGQNAVLQVDDDNQAAIALYAGMGFERQTVQTAWQRPARSAPPEFAASVFDLRLRAPGEWRAHYALAALVRPEGLSWLRPLNRDDFRPSWRRQLARFLSAGVDEHWVAPEPGVGRGLAASLSLRQSAMEGDELTLLVRPEYRGQLERPLLSRGLRRLGRRPWPARIEVDAGDAHTAGVLREMGFQPRRTLRWMRKDLGGR